MRWNAICLGQTGSKVTESIDTHSWTASQLVILMEVFNIMYIVVRILRFATVTKWVKLSHQSSTLATLPTPGESESVFGRVELHSSLSRWESVIFWIGTMFQSDLGIWLCFHPETILCHLVNFYHSNCTSFWPCPPSLTNTWKKCWHDLVMWSVYLSRFQYFIYFGFGRVNISPGEWILNSTLPPGEWLSKILAMTGQAQTELVSSGWRAMSLWRNRLARSAVNRKVGGSSPPRDVGVFGGSPTWKSNLQTCWKSSKCCLTVVLLSTAPAAPDALFTAVVAEWLRRWTRNPLGSARAGSNPADCVHFFHTWIQGQPPYSSAEQLERCLWIICSFQSLLQSWPSG